MHIRKRYLFALIVILAGLFWLWRMNAIKVDDEHRFNFNLQQLRGVAKLVIWEQDFSLNDVESQEKTYFSWITTKESVATSVNGKMGFHIDLGDSIHTKIERDKDTIIIKAPLQITYVSLDMATLQQVKEASLDPSINVDKNEIIKHLDQKALQKYIPQLSDVLKNKPLTSQQKQLGRLIGRPVKIILTQMPPASSWKD